MNKAIKYTYLVANCEIVDRVIFDKCEISQITKTMEDKRETIGCQTKIFTFAR